MSPYSSEEIVTREFVIREKPKGIINIVDATNIERNLYLTMQLLELGFPMVVALNMMDELRENDGSVMVNEMEEALGVPVIPISAVKGEGIEELVRHAVHVAKYQERPMDTDFCKKEEGIHRGLHAVMHLIEDHAQMTGIPVRFAASKILEGDAKILEQLELTENEQLPPHGPSPSLPRSVWRYPSADSAHFPGVTVDRKDGVIRGYENTLLTDLPGIYSMSP